MAKADRLERLDAQRLHMEADYRAALIEALKVTAAGQWGLFDHRADKFARKAVEPTIAALEELAQSIDEARETLFLDPFELHREFMAARGPVASNAVGEPKQARAWLERLAGDKGE